MRIQEGKEADVIGCRLKDIIYLAEETRPVNEDDWKGYAQSVLRLIANQAYDAQTALTVLSLTNKDHVANIQLI